MSDRKAYNKEYYLEHKDNIKARMLKYKDRNKATRKKHSLQNKESGLCVSCSDIAMAGKVKCEKCATKQNVITAKYYPYKRQKYIAEGRCVACSAPVDEGYLTCFNCRHKDTYRTMKVRKYYATDSQPNTIGL